MVGDRSGGGPQPAAAVQARVRSQTPRPHTRAREVSPPLTTYAHSREREILAVTALVGNGSGYQPCDETTTFQYQYLASVGEIVFPIPVVVTQAHPT